jgi:carlactone synthase/all-trans-10'-apo-beta-carotenal 13,14-cleaving dioxygenase
MGEINNLVVHVYVRRVGRFIIPLDGSPYGKLEAALDPEEHGKGMDMCSFNPAYLGKKYRYAYACGAQRPCNFPNTLTKVKVTTTKITYYTYILPLTFNFLQLVF